MRLGGVSLEFEVLVPEIFEASGPRVEVHHGQGVRLSRQLKSGLLDVIEIQVGVAEGVYELPGLEVTHLR